MVMDKGQWYWDSRLGWVSRQMWEDMERIRDQARRDFEVIRQELLDELAREEEQR